ncbi:hypothetical protein KSF_105100 [Reticulibacter mediterranei]|uniref:histidine kinase n=1 Tax=Reticulibacter mediterranei TaxID=2778369 RepID=A0A8J3N6K9_9CHLR|nr:sensor histidine kinase [Reticulibacter mediterranei]GHP00463.1 hypothetical protein KSF_105100 [Reticulibacter mediterranei]
MVHLISIIAQSINDKITRRWFVVYSGVLVQIIVLVLANSGFGQAQSPAIQLAPVAGNPNVCRVVQVVPFTNVWRFGVQAGDIVQLRDQKTGSQSCLASGVSIQAPSAILEQQFVVNASPQPVSGLDVALKGVLVLIFSLMGIAIFLHARSRPVAFVSYGLFSCVSLIFCLQSVFAPRTFWVSLLLFFLMLILPGLAATAVNLFPSVAFEQGGRPIPPRQLCLLSSPLLVALLLVVVEWPALLIWPQAHLLLLLLIALYSVACIGVILWTLLLGVRHLKRREQPMTFLIVIGILCLLVWLTLSLNFTRSGAMVRPGLLSLLPLPLAYGYALLRHQLVGTTSLISRRVMRVVLWLMLASLFVFPATVVFSVVSTSASLSEDQWFWLSVPIGLLSLWLFPLTWHRVRDLGDQVFYHDFYQYNHALCELSTALTRFQGIDQISAFVLPHLAHLLNASECALLVSTRPQESPYSTTRDLHEITISWQVYHYMTGPQGTSTERLIRLAQLASTYCTRHTEESLFLDNMLLLAFYESEQLTGFLCLGPKQNLEPYSQQDISFLTTLAAQLSVLEVNCRYLVQAQAHAQQLTALNHRVVSAQEEERRHLALELHDEALQLVMLVVRQLSEACTMTEVAEVMPLVRSVEEDLRRTCLHLRPPLLDELGLEEALGFLAQQSRQRGKTSGHDMHIQVSCTGTSSSRLPATVELALYRVAQEALSNALKHARANTITVRLRRSQSGMVSLLIADDGRGIGSHQPLKERLGLIGMQERMRAIGGHWQIRSSSGCGVTIRATYVPPPSCTTLMQEGILTSHHS